LKPLDDLCPVFNLFEYPVGFSQFIFSQLCENLFLTIIYKKTVEEVEPLRGSEQRSDHPLPRVSPVVIEIKSLWDSDFVLRLRLAKETRLRRVTFAT
jgi:hypothetical protein